MNSDNLIQLNSLLLNSLPDTTHGADDKTASSCFKPTYKALQNSFIRYNTKKTVNTLLFDHDKVKKPLEEYAVWLESKINCKPTFITQTTNGFQFGFILDKTVFTHRYSKKFLISKYLENGYSKKDATQKAKINSEEFSNDYKSLQNIKKNITSLINGDVAGSHRMIGIWRNPLAHNHIFNDIKYSIFTLAAKTQNANNLFELAPAPEHQTSSIKLSNVKMKMGTDGTVNDAINQGFVEGNRNNYLFSIGFKTVFEDRIKASTIEKELHQINKSHTNHLTEYEVKKISESILKLVPTMYQPKRDKPHGKYFKEMQELGIHGTYNRRAYAGFAVARDRTINQVENIVNAFIELFERGVTKPINQDIADFSKASIRTIQRYKKVINPQTVFKEWLNNLMNNITHKIDIRPYVTPLLNQTFKGIKKRVEKLQDGTLFEYPLQKSELLQMQRVEL